MTDKELAAKKAAQKRWYDKNRDAENERCRRWRLENKETVIKRLRNPEFLEKKKNYDKAYRKQHAIRSAATAKQWRSKAGAEFKAQQKKYKQERRTYRTETVDRLYRGRKMIERAKSLPLHGMRRFRLEMAALDIMAMADPIVREGRGSRPPYRWKVS